MITLSDDEVALLRSLLTALRGIKVREIDRALVILSKAGANANRSETNWSEVDPRISDRS